MYIYFQCVSARVHTSCSKNIPALLLLPTVRMSWQRNVGHAPAAICSTKPAQKSVILTHISPQKQDEEMDRWIDGSMEMKCYSNKVWFIVSSSQDSVPFSSSFPPS